jgi:hypothetical protein
MSRPPRRSSSLLLIVASLVFTGALSAVGCAQKEGERCERNEDCEGELECLEKTPTGGVCRPRDFRSPVDSAVPDLPAAEVAVEAPPVDAAAETAIETAPESAPDITVDAPDDGGDAPRLDVGSDTSAG